MKKLLTLLTLAFALAACQQQTSEQENSAVETANAPAEAVEDVIENVTIVHDANIYTVDNASPKIEAFAYQGRRIIATGSFDELSARYSGATTIDLNGATVVPGFIDAHGHLLGLGQSLMRADLSGTRSKSEIIDILKQSAETLSDGQWLLGRGWDQNDWEVKQLPTAADLDAVFPDRPIWLERIDGHATWANSKAMEVADQDLNGSWQPDGGEIVRDANGNASGVFIDNAVELIQNKVPKANDRELVNALQQAMRKTASVGLTGLHDAGTSLKTWQLLTKLQQQDQLITRIYAMANGANEMLDSLCDAGSVIDSDAMLTARSVKLYSDGALGSRGAALLAEYSDAPNNVGLLIESEETLSKHAKRAVNCGLQVNIHAIGDRGNRITLNVLESAQNAENPGRHRIEHSQVVALTDFQRFKDLKLIASVQPTHATSDMYWAEERVGAERIIGAYAWQTFAELGVPLALGSDVPVEKPDPLLGFYAAISRQDAKNWPDNGWYPEQRLSRAQALHGFTLGAAYAAFQEDKLGSISVGKYADFVVLSKDIMQVPQTDILNTEVLATYLNGEAIYLHGE